MNITEFRARIKNLIGSNKTKQAIDEMLKATKNTEWYDSVIMQSSRLVRLNSDTRKNILNENEKNREIAQINHALLELSNEIEQINPSSAVAQPPTVKENPYMTEHQEEKPLAKNILLPAIAGGALLIIILGLLAFLPEPNDKQYQIYRIILSLASGAFAAIIPGFIHFNYKPYVQATGALAVFAMVYFFNPAGTETEAFDFTVFIKTTEGESVLKNEGKLTMQIENDMREENIDGDGGVDIKRIPAQLKGDSVSVTLEAEGWQFTNGKPSMYLQLTGNNTTLYVERDNSLCCIEGSVRNDKSQFLEGVKINIGNVFTQSDENGRFSITIPKEKQKKEQTLIATKEGYKIWVANVYPATKQEVEIILPQ